MNISKGAIRRIEIEARKQMREKNKDSAFMRKSLNIYNGQSARCADSNLELPYTIVEFRVWLKPFVGSMCGCGQRITLKKLSVDHEIPVSRNGGWELINLRARCRSCNLRKGAILPDEYSKLVALLGTFTAESREDIFRRLVIGGKYTFK